MNVSNHRRPTSEWISSFAEQERKRRKEAIQEAIAALILFSMAIAFAFALILHL